MISSNHFISKRRKEVVQNQDSRLLMCLLPTDPEIQGIQEAQNYKTGINVSTTENEGTWRNSLRDTFQRQEADFFNVYLFTYLGHAIRHAGSSSPTRYQACAPHIGSAES